MKVADEPQRESNRGAPRYKCISECAFDNYDIDSHNDILQTINETRSKALWDKLSQELRVKERKRNANEQRKLQNNYQK